MKLPAPSKDAPVVVIDTYGENYIPVPFTDIRMDIRGPDLVLITEAGEELILAHAAQLASINQKLYTLVFSDGKEITSENLTSMVSSVELAPEAGTERPGDSSDTSSVDEIVVVADTGVKSTGQDRIDGRATVSVSEFVSNESLRRKTDDWSETATSSSSGSSSKTKDADEIVPPTEGLPDPIEPGPTDPISPSPTVPLVLLQQMGHRDDSSAIYIGGTGDLLAVSNPSVAVQYSTEVIELSDESQGWTIYADNPSSANYLSRVLSFENAAGSITLLGVPLDIHIVYGSTPHGVALGLLPHQVLIQYPQDKAGYFAMTAEYPDSSGTQQQYEVNFLIVDNPQALVDDNGTFLLAADRNATEVRAGSGNDTIYAGFGVTHIYAGNGDDTIVAGSRADYYDGQGGVDTVDYSNSDTGINASLINGVIDTDKIHHVVVNIENIVGTNYDDVIEGDNGNNRLEGRAGNDRFFGSASDDFIDGGDGINTIDYSRLTAAIEANLLDGVTVKTSGGTDTFQNVAQIVGTQFNDTLVGDASDNSFFSGEGDDILEGRGGNNLLDGGEGFDTVRYITAPTGVVVNLERGNATNGWGGIDTLQSIEKVIGSSHNDDLRAGADGHTLEGGDGDDQLTGGAGNDFLYGDAGNDTFIASPGSDLLDGGTGIDTVDYSGWSNGIQVNLANETVTKGSGIIDVLRNIENVIGTAYSDTIHGDMNSNHLQGGAGNDWLRGRGGDNLLDGGSGDQDWADYRDAPSGILADLRIGTVVNGWGGTDTLIAIEGIAGTNYNDTFISRGSGVNYFYGGAGDDTFIGGAGIDVYYVGGISSKGVFVDLAAGVADDGLGGQDTLNSINWVFGSSIGNDVVRSSNNDDRFDGLGGDDRFIGGLGNDIFNGGDGSDTIDYSELGNSVSVNLGTGVAIKGNGYSDTLNSVENVTGTSLNDVLRGSASANVLTGGAGDDTLSGMAGNDILIGGDGEDTATYVYDPAGIDANLTTGIVTDGWGGMDVLSSIEAIQGSNFNDTFRVASMGDLNRYDIDGGNGVDTLVAQGSAGATWTLTNLSNVERYDFHNGLADTIGVDLSTFGAGGAHELLVDVTDTVNIAAATGWSLGVVDGNDVWTNGSHSLSIIAV